jgi:hypothetical protein
MKEIILKTIPHTVQIGDHCGHIAPNLSEDAMFIDPDLGGEPIGFYLKKLPAKLCNLAAIANAELLSDRVPKSVMNRKKPIEVDGQKAYLNVSQYSTIIGAVPPKPHMRRDYPCISSVHQHKSAQNFIRAMLLLARESEELIRELLPKTFAFQEAAIRNNCPPEFRFGRLFTSSISNFNISAAFHRDAANLEGCVNVIIAKKHNATGGNTTVPDYGLTVDSCDDSMLVYPAWRNVHGVTPIVPTKPGGYRNSLVFYPLKSFKKYVK